MKTVLIVCTANLIRSPLAAALLRKKLKQAYLTGVQVDSAGTWAEPGLSARRSIRDLEGRLGIDLEGHRSRMISAELLAEADVVYVMEADHLEALRCEFPAQVGKIHLLSSLEDRAYDIPDPAEDSESCRVLARELARIFDHALPTLMRHLELTLPAGDPISGEVPA